MTTTSPPKSHWSLLRECFSIRGLKIGIVVLFGIWLVCLAVSAHAQRKAVAAIHRADGNAVYDLDLRLADDLSLFDGTAKTALRRWLVDRFGIDYFGSIERVDSFLNPKDTSFLEHLGALKGLRWLNLQQVACDDDALRGLRNLDQLESLSVSSKQIDGSFLRDLPNPQALTNLHLTGTNLSRANVELLPRFTSLAKLSIEGQGVTDESIQSISNFKKLGQLGIENSNITNAGLAQLANLKLRYLILQNTSVDDLSGIARMRTLSYLRLKGPITDATLASIPALPNLNMIFLDTDQITDAGLVHLAKLPALRQIDIVTSCNLKQGVAALRAKSPKIQIRVLPRVSTSEKFRVRVAKPPISGGR